MADNNQRNDDVRRGDLRQKNEEGKEVTRTGSTGGDINTGEWKPGNDAHTPLKIRRPAAVPGKAPTLGTTAITPAEVHRGDVG